MNKPFDLSPLENEQQFFLLWAIHNAGIIGDDSVDIHKEANRLVRLQYPVVFPLRRLGMSDFENALIDKFHSEGMVTIAKPEEDQADTMIRLILAKKPIIIH